MSGHVIAEIRADALRQNLRAIREQLAPGTAICAMVKANAYGHGLAQVMSVLSRAGVERVAVAQLPEALEIRASGWSRPILCLGLPLIESHWRDRKEWAAEAVAHRIHCTVSTLEEARLLADQARRQNTQATVEIKIDTGMGRLGLLGDSTLALIAGICACPELDVDGVYTHLASADESDLGFTDQQLKLFDGLVKEVRALSLPVRRFHAANSAAIFRRRTSHWDLVRPGLALYGYWAGPAAERPEGLVPCLRVVGELLAVRDLPVGHTVGYGQTHTLRRDSRVGVIPIGYADGYRRLLGGNAVMTLAPVRGQLSREVPVIGRVSMDLVTIDLTEAGDVRPGDPVVIISDNPSAPNSVEALARKLDSIPYEITCLLGARVARVLVDRAS